MAMTMESLYSGRQDVRKLYTGDTEPATGSAGIIKFSTYLAVFRINPQPYTQIRIGREGSHMQSLKLCQGIEGQMA